LSKLRQVKAEKVVKALTKLGFEIARQKGNHQVMKHRKVNDASRRFTN